MSLSSLHSAVSQQAEECPDWKAILAAYQGAVEAYSRAVADAAGLSPSGFPAGFPAAWQRAEAARQNCDNLRAQLLDHEHYHECFVAASDACGPRPASRSFRRY